ncbi:hypothetical protein PMI29_05535 [Pseudomonas sp. GM49]|nr:hypothetical protein PMI29_05535 [Pseudomonas sp. GM49]
MSDAMYRAILKFAEPGSSGRALGGYPLSCKQGGLK